MLSRTIDLMCVWCEEFSIHGADLLAYFDSATLANLQQHYQVTNNGMFCRPLRIRLQKYINELMDIRKATTRVG